MKDLTPETRAFAEAVGLPINAKATSLDEAGYLKDEVTLRLTALEAGALEGALGSIARTDRFLVNVKGHAHPMSITARIIEKLQAAHAIYRKEQGL